MVQIATVRELNARFTKEQHTGVVCVFVGATAGIGFATLETMIQMFADSTFYVLGRSAAKFKSQQSAFQRLGPSNKIVFIESEVSLVSGVDDACKQIAARESKVDYLYMSAGKVPFEGASYTKEGLEISFALSYYTRIRMVSNLITQLQQSSRPRILSVLNGGKEQQLIDDDLGLHRNWGPRNMIVHSTMMMSLMFERFSSQNQQMTFSHAYPGLVKTEIISGMTPLPGASIWNRITLAALRGFMALLMLLTGVTAESCGERQAFHLTSEDFGSGHAWRINEKSEVVSDPGAMTKYRSGSWMDRIWDSTIGVFDTALGKGRETSQS